MIPETSSALAAAALYAGLNGLILLGLSVHVIRVRVREKVYMGDAGNPAMIRAARGHANFAEHVPLALILIMLAAFLGAPAWAVHLLGAALTLGRLLHAAHFVQADAPAWQRGGGMALTYLVLLLGGLGVTAHALTQL